MQYKNLKKVGGGMPPFSSAYVSASLMLCYDNNDCPFSIARHGNQDPHEGVHQRDLC